MAIVYITIGIVIGLIISKYLGHGSDNGKGIKDLNSERQEAKEKSLDEVMELFDFKQEIANNDVEKLLGVSDATATNYLKELESKNLITQIGREGRGVTYRKNG